MEIEKEISILDAEIEIDPPELVRVVTQSFAQFDINDRARRRRISRTSDPFLMTIYLFGYFIEQLIDAVERVLFKRRGRS